jgi:hypothetical protein
VLQEVWSRVYAAVIASPHNVNAKRSDAEEQAWEAVRRANGGEMPQERVESVICGPREPTNEEMVEVLAPIVAKSRHGEAWNRLDAYVQAAHINDIAAQLRTGDSTIARITIASWKAARAWGRK